LAAPAAFAAIAAIAAVSGVLSGGCISAEPDPVYLAAVDALVSGRVGGRFDSAALLSAAPAGPLAASPAGPGAATLSASNGTLPGAPGESSSPGEAATLTLDAAVARALSRNLSLTAGAENLAVAQAALAQAGLLPNPTLGQNGGFLIPFSPAGLAPFTADVALSTGLNALLLRRPRIDLATAQRMQTGIDLAAQAFDLSQQVESKYRELEHLVRNRSLAERVVTLYTRTVEAAEARARVGVVPPSEVNRARLQLSDARRTVRRLESQYRRAAGELDFLMGVTGGREPTWGLPAESSRPPDPATLPTVPGDEALTAVAAGGRLDLLRAGLDREIAGTSLAIAQLGLIPTITIGSDFIYQNNPVGSQNGTRLKTWTGGPLINVGLPIFDPGIVAVKAADAQLRKAAKTYTALDAQVRQDVRAAGANLEISRRDVLFYRDEFIPQQEENVKQAELSFRLGNTDLDSLLNTLRDYVAALQSYEDAVADFQSNAVALQRAAGMTLPRLAEEARRPREDRAAERREDNR
jgi:outer membrane protein TolC